MSGKRSLRDILSEVPDTDPSLLQNMIKSRGDLNQSSTLKGSASMDRISARQSLRPSGSFLSVQADSRKRTDSIVSARSVGSLTSGRSVGSLTASKLTQTRLALMKGELELHFELITEMLLDEVQPGYNPLLVIKWRKSKWVNAVKGVGSTGTTDTLKRRMYSSWFVSNEELQDYLSTRLTIHHQNLASQTTSRIEPQLALDGGTDLLLQFLADPEPSVLSRQSLEPSPRPFQDSVSHSSAKQHPSITQDTESASVDSDVLQNDSKSHIMDTAYRDTTQRSSFAHNKALLLTDNVKPHPIASTPVSKPSKALSSKASSFTSVSKASEAYSRNYRPLPANLGLHVSIATQSKPELPSSPPRLPQEQQLELTKTDEKILAKLGNVSKQVLDLNHHFYSAEQNLKIFKNNFRLLEIKLNPASSPAPSKSSPSQPLRRDLNEASNQTLQSIKKLQSWIKANIEDIQHSKSTLTKLEEKQHLLSNTVTKLSAKLVDVSKHHNNLLDSVADDRWSSTWTSQLGYSVFAYLLRFAAYLFWLFYQITGLLLFIFCCGRRRRTRE